MAPNTSKATNVLGKSAKPQYRVNVGINYPPDRRAEPGDVVDDIPGSSVAWLLEDGVIELVKEGS